MTLLEKAIPPTKAKPQKPKILIFGKAGVGKTWASLDFPNAIYVDSEGGASLSHYTDKLAKSGGMYFGIAQGAGDLKTVVELVKELATTKHNYKTVVIDSISKLFNSEIAKEAERLEKAGLKNEFAADKKPAVALTRRLINWIDKIDMNVILISHEKAEYQGGEEIGQTFDAHNKLEYELHLCLQIVKTGKTRKARIRKTRLKEFPEASSFDWSYEEFAKAYGEEIINATPQAIELATPEQLEELKKLLEIIKLDNNEIDKWFSKAKVESWEEFAKTQLESIISHLKGKALSHI